MFQLCEKCKTNPGKKGIEDCPGLYCNACFSSLNSIMKGRKKRALERSLRLDATPEKYCLWCKDGFVTNIADNLFCSNECKKKFRIAQKNEAWKKSA